MNLTLQNGFSFNGDGDTGAINLRRWIGDSPPTFFSSFRDPT